MGAIVDLWHWIMTPLYYATSGILKVFHGLWADTLGLPEGVSWALAIIGLTLVIRILLIPLFVKQIKSSRNMQVLGPKLKELQKKYGHDRERMVQEQMKLYKETGTNPFASCLPLLAQMPIFLALFHTLSEAARNTNGVGFMTDADAKSLADSAFLHLGGVVHLADSFTGSSATGPKVFAISLVVLMTLTTFTTQRQLMSKNMPESAMTGQYAQQQKMLLYVLPLVFAVGGIAFPIGLLLYWCTSNIWTMGQQFWVIRNNPTPGTPAYEAKKQRDAAKNPVRAESTTAARDGGATNTTQHQSDVQPRRQQPKKQTRSQRKRK